MSLISGPRRDLELERQDPDLHILLRYGYPKKLSKNVRIRRMTIKKSIRKTSFDSVWHKMEDLQDTLSKDYKERRLKEDMNWLKSNCQRFHQSIF